MAWNNTHLSPPRSGGQKPDGEPQPHTFRTCFGSSLSSQGWPSSARLSPLGRQLCWDLPAPTRNEGSLGPRALPVPTVHSPPQAVSTLAGNGEDPRGRPCLDEGFGKEGSPHVQKQKPRPRELQT